MPHNMPTSSSVSDHLSCAEEEKMQTPPNAKAKKKNQGRYRLGASDLPPPRLLSSTGTRTGNTKTKIAANTPPAHPSIHPPTRPIRKRDWFPALSKRKKIETRNPEILSRNANGLSTAREKKEMGYLMASFKVVVVSDKLGEAQVSSPSTCARQRRGPCRGPPRTSGR